MIKFIPFEQGDVIGFTALDGENKIGSCMFSISGYSMNFETVDCGDDIITEGLARAAMNYAANRNAYIAKIRKELSTQAFIRLGFEGEEVLSVEIPEALASGCTCGSMQ